MSDFVIDLSVRVQAANADEAHIIAQKIADHLMMATPDNLNVATAAYWNVEEESDEYYEDEENE